MDDATRPTPTGPARPGSLRAEQAERLAETLGAMIRQDLGGEVFPNPEGWQLRAASRDYLMMEHVPVAWFVLDGRTLNFIVTPRDESRACYQRTARFDVTYFSYDADDDAQHEIYARDREMIDRFVQWLSRRDPVRTNHTARTARTARTGEREREPT